MLIIYALWFCMSACVMDECQEIELQKVRDSLSKNIQSQNKNHVVIVGQTGAGKSTLFNYLVGQQCIGKDPKDTGEFSIEIPDAISKVVGGGKNSQTGLPIGHNNFWDCLGFSDTRSPIQNITNAYAFHDLICKYALTKIIVAASDKSLYAGWEGSFFLMLNFLVSMFREKGAQRKKSKL